MGRTFQSDIYSIKIGSNPKDCFQFVVGKSVNIAGEEAEVTLILEDYNSSIDKGSSVYRIYVTTRDGVQRLWQTIENMPIIAINKI